MPYHSSKIRAVENISRGYTQVNSYCINNIEMVKIEANFVLKTKKEQKMKNKFTTLILTFLTCLSITQAINCQEITEEVCCLESLNETLIQEFNECKSDSYRYVSIGVGPILFIPNFGIGYRERYSHLGYDTGLSFSTVGYVHQLSAHLVGHYYLHESQNSAYLGLGLMGSGVIPNRGRSGLTLSPDFIFGKEFEKNGESRHFIEMHVAVPTLWVNSKGPRAMYFPLMYIKYGTSF